MKYYQSCLQLFIFVEIMISRGLCGASIRTCAPWSVLRIESAFSPYPQTVAKIGFRSTRSYFSMKYDETKPTKKNDSNPKITKRPAAKPSFVRSSSTISREDQTGVQKLTVDSDGVRLNKCLHGLSRRGADDAISEGRVTVNNVVATNGIKVKKRDVVRLVSSICIA